MEAVPDAEVLAVGPVFEGDGPGRPRRVVLLARGAGFVVVTCDVGVDGHSLEPSDRGDATPEFTLAVRLFCDRVLEQAWHEDARNEP